MSDSIFYLIMLGMLVFSFLMFLITMKKRRDSKKARLNKMKELNAKDHGQFKHAFGLPLPKNVDCDVYFCKDKIMIDSLGSIFNLSFSKISDITLISNVEIQKALVSSAGGAIAGGMNFGALGALIGGRIQEREIRTLTRYLVVTYYKSGVPNYIAFEATKLETNRATNMVKLFRLLPQSQRIEVNL